MRPPQQRNQLIDVLRGISIIMVVVCHCPLFWTDPRRYYFGRDVDSIRRGMGYYGVAIFFVISGFLITGNTLKRYGSLRRIRPAEFWWMRFARIYPMLIPCLVAMAAFHFARLPTGFAFQDGATLRQAITAVLSFRYYEVFNWSKGGGSWAALWSLSVEEMFYLAFPFACLAVDGVLAGFWICLFTIATALNLRLGGMTPYSTLGAMDLLALGCLVALCRPHAWRERFRGRTRTFIGAACGTLGLILIIAVAFGRYPLDHNADWGPLGCGCGAAFVLIASQFLNVPRVLSHALLPISSIGVASYELYLIHLPVVVALCVHYPGHLWWIAFFSVALAFVLHRFYAEPLNRELRALVFQRPSNPERPSSSSGRRGWGIATRVGALIAIIFVVAWAAARL